MCLRLYGGGGILPTSSEATGGVDDTPLMVEIVIDDYLRGVKLTREE